MATKAQVEAFINMIAPIAVKEAKLHGGKIFPSVCIAQACCESAYGTSPKMINANAVFGIKVGKSAYHFGTAWKDRAYSTKTKECYDGRTYTAITDMFRAYDSIEESVEDYFDLLCTASRYRYALNTSTPLACITGIQMAPYATSPTYVNTIMGIINNQKLTQYDCEIKYLPNRTYQLKNDMYVRKTPNGAKIRYEDLAADAKRKGQADADGNAIMNKGSKVTCKGMTGNWMKTAYGYICAVSDSCKVYIS